MEEWEWGPGLLLDAGQTPGEGASLTSSMCLWSVIKTRLIGAVVMEEPVRSKRTSLERVGRQVYHPQQRETLGAGVPILGAGSRARLTEPRGCGPPPTSGPRWGLNGARRDLAPQPDPLGDNPTPHQKSKGQNGLPDPGG